ncbi:MAG TPA: VOC family protein [Gaiellaceae bacterium]|nr:VOC family protein [Gaiellaceae bacterium]
MVRGIHQVVLEVADQDRALAFWTGLLGFALVRDERYRDERWLEVRTPDNTVTVVLSLREGEVSTAPNEVPTSNLFFYCDDLPGTYEELRTRGVEFPQPPVQQPFGWWSMFQDSEGNRFALTPRDET